MDSMTKMCNYLRKIHEGEGALDESVESKNPFNLVRWNEYHSISGFSLIEIHQFGSTALPETLSEYVWYGGGAVWKGTLMVPRPSLSRWTK